MKKFLRVALGGFMAAVLITGCSKKEGSTDSTAETSAEVVTEATTADGETVDAGKLTKLGQYKGLEIERMSTEVTDEELEKRIQNILDANPEYVVITDRAAQNGDVVNIDFKGLKDGVAFDGGSSEGYMLELGSGTFIAGFEEGLTGAKTGEERSLDLTFPDDYYNDELAGQAVVFEVKVNSIEEKRKAVLDENFVQRMSDFNTVDEFKADTLADIQEEKELQAEQQLENDLLMAVIDGSEFELNEEAVNESYDEQISYYSSMAGMYGMTLEDYAGIFGMTEEAFKEATHDSAEMGIKQQLVTEAITDQEKLQVEDADRVAVALENGMDLQTMQENYGEEEVDKAAMMYKVVQFLKDNATIK